MADPPFWQAAVLQSIGPLITVSIGGFLAARFTARTQQHREDQQLRRELIDSMAETSSSLYLATQHYWRVKIGDPPPGQLDIARAALDEKYHENRVRGEVMEAKLGGTFRRGEAKRCWHGVMDLLTVRYFQLLDRATDNLLRSNAGPQHSGLSVEELRDPGRLLNAYHERLDQAMTAARTEPLAREGRLREWLQLRLPPARSAGGTAPVTTGPAAHSSVVPP